MNEAMKKCGKKTAFPYEINLNMHTNVALQCVTSSYDVTSDGTVTLYHFSCVRWPLLSCVFSIFSYFFGLRLDKIRSHAVIFFLNFNFFVIYTLVSVVAVYENTKTNTYISIRIHSFRFQCLFKLMEKETSKKKKIRNA